MGVREERAPGGGRDLDELDPQVAASIPDYWGGGKLEEQ